MDPTDIGLFRLAEQRMRWLDQRQSILAQNISNVNTPGFKARDLGSFGDALQSQAGTLQATNPQHLQGNSATLSGREQIAGGKAPNGNTVAMEEQLGKIAETSSSQELVTNLYHKYQTMFHMVLGRG